MAKKNSYGIVYSTDPGFKLPEELPESQTLPPAEQKLLVRLDTKNRGGKAVSLVTGFIGTESDLSDLGKKLKAYCGTGGSVKDGYMIIQGDNREKIVQWLLKNGFRQTVKSK